MQPEQSSGERTTLTYCLFQCIHDGVVSATVAGHNEAEPPARIDEYLS
jgi:hypothetical protein